MGSGGRIFRAFSGLSLLGAILAAGLWVRSYKFADIAGLFASRGTLQAAGSCRGSLYLFFSNLQLGDERRWTADYARDSAKSFEPIGELLFESPKADIKRLGFRLTRGPDDAFGIDGCRFRVIVLPLWFVLAGSAILPAVRLRRWLRDRRRLRRGWCAHCGYDLRESRERCPECGTPRVVPCVPLRTRVAHRDAAAHAHVVVRIGGRLAGAAPAGAEAQHAGAGIARHDEGDPAATPRRGAVARGNRAGRGNGGP